MRAHRIPNEVLLEAALTLMKQEGQPLERVRTNTRSMQYALPNGETVRVRTCNDPVLVVVADSPNKGAALNIEGTDHLLIVMPEIPRTAGSVVAYLVPTNVAVEAVRSARADWLASNPNTKGENRTWNIWFNDAPKSGGFAETWAKYRLHGSASTLRSTRSPGSTGGTLGDVIAAAKRQIANAAGVPLDAVKITVELG
jgi:hypothetical protein